MIMVGHRLMLKLQNFINSTKHFDCSGFFLSFFKNQTPKSCHLLILLQKYYWPEDTCTGRQQFHLPNEIMLSEEKRELKIAQIVQKVHVTVEKIEKRGMVKESCNGLRRREMKELVCCRKYEADRKKFVALLKPPPAEVVEID